MAGAYRGVPHTGEWRRRQLDRWAAQMRQRNARVARIRETLRKRFALAVLEAIDAADVAARGLKGGVA